MSPRLEANSSGMGRNIWLRFDIAISDAARFNMTSRLDFRFNEARA
jgi:hypothetical protein